MKGNWNSHLLLVQIQNGAGTLENGLIVICKKFLGSLDTFSIQPSNPAFRYLSRRNENLYLYIRVTYKATALCIIASNWN